MPSSRTYVERLPNKRVRRGECIDVMQRAANSSFERVKKSLIAAEQDTVVPG